MLGTGVATRVHVTLESNNMWDTCVVIIIICNHGLVGSNYMLHVGSGFGWISFDNLVISKDIL